jgi:hypothetical protein
MRPGVTLRGLVMSDIDGTQPVKFACANPVARGTPTAVLSGEEGPAVEAHASAPGANDHPASCSARSLLQAHTTSPPAGRAGPAKIPGPARITSGAALLLGGADMSTAEGAVARGWRRALPALTLVLLAPLTAEVLPGATRLSSLFVLPVEMCVWGGGALLIRYAVRRWQLGWANMLALALALAVAEECLIQQTSLAPMVLRLRGETYARALGVNYVYLLWALAYEAVFVVILPVHLAELIFPGRREELWVGKAGLVATAVLFFLGCFLAWYSWTRVARPSVFHVPVYDPPLGATLTAAAAVGGLIFLALGPYRHALSRRPAPLNPPAPWLLGAAGALWAVLWYGLVLLGFGIAPSFPPAAAVGAGLLLAALILCLLPRWAAGPRWRRGHEFGVIFGTMLGSMLAGFIGFIGSAPADLYFKVFMNLLAVALMIALALRTR